MPYRNDVLAARERKAALCTELAELDAEVERLRRLDERRRIVIRELERLRGSRRRPTRFRFRRLAVGLVLTAFAASLGWAVVSGEQGEAEVSPHAVDGAQQAPSQGEWSGL